MRRTTEPSPWKTPRRTFATGTSPGVTDQTWAAIRASIDEMSRTSGSGVGMCHGQGKTAVYLLDDGKSLVEHGRT